MYTTIEDALEYAFKHFKEINSEYENGNPVCRDILIGTLMISCFVNNIRYQEFLITAVNTYKKSKE